MTRTPGTPKRLDAEALLHAVPAEETLLELSPAERKSVAQLLVARILDALEALRCEPDDWESPLLSAAIGAIAVGTYLPAIQYCRMATVPPGKRRGMMRRPAVPMTLAQLREALEVAGAKAAPLE